jgi:riboflavin transporter FmnP
MSNLRLTQIAFFVTISFITNFFAIPFLFQFLKLEFSLLFYLFALSFLALSDVLLVIFIVSLLLFFFLTQELIGTTVYFLFNVSVVFLFYLCLLKNFSLFNFIFFFFFLLGSWFFLNYFLFLPWYNSWYRFCWKETKCQFEKWAWFLTIFNLVKLSLILLGYFWTYFPQKLVFVKKAPIKKVY